MKRSIFWTLTAVLATALVGVGLVAALNVRGEADIPASETFDATPAQVARGDYLAKVGNCMACHTPQGGQAYAGGRGIETPFGVVYSSNLTPNAEHGLGRWSSAEFWRAMHHGRSQSGRLLYPAFPYPNYTAITRDDSDAIYAYLRSLPAVAQPNRAHDLRFPYSTQPALAVWRALFFAPGKPAHEPAQTAEWNRGAYLVQGLGHCTACHTPRNALGATSEAQAFSGGLIPVQNWYAPALTSPAEAGVQRWSVEDITALMTTGLAPQASVMGPMAEVVFRSTQFLTPGDARAMAVYLKALPAHGADKATAAASTTPATATSVERGAAVYEQQCVQCHGAQGQGQGQGQGQAGAFPALAGNRAVTMADSTNVLRVVLQGGYLPATQGNPRPHGMPPFQHLLSDEEVAAVASYIRSSWGNSAPAVATMQVYRTRERGSR